MRVEKRCFFQTRNDFFAQSAFLQKFFYNQVFQPPPIQYHLLTTNRKIRNPLKSLFKKSSVKTYGEIKISEDLRKQIFSSTKNSTNEGNERMIIKHAGGVASLRKR